MGQQDTRAISIPEQDKQGPAEVMLSSQGPGQSAQNQAFGIRSVALAPAPAAASSPDQVELKSVRSCEGDKNSHAATPGLHVLDIS